MHSLKQSSLGLWRSTVDFVSKEKVTEQWSWFECKLALLGVIDVGTCDVSREQVRRELYTLEVTTKRISEGVGHQCLCQTRVIFEQKVTVRQDVDQHIVDDVRFSDNHFLHFSSNRLRDCADVGQAGFDLGAGLVLRLGRSGRCCWCWGWCRWCCRCCRHRCWRNGCCGGGWGHRHWRRWRGRGCGWGRGLHVYCPPGFNFPNVVSAGLPLAILRWSRCGWN